MKKRYSRSLSISMPELLTVIRVIPERNEMKEMVEDEEVERIGMEVAMEYKRQRGRVPEDVTKENFGFDIRSRIEVKARAGEGDVALTPNEWFKARRFKEQYWLYVVANAATNPMLYIINNPAENLKPQEKVEVVRFVVPVKEWKNNSSEVVRWEG